MPIYPKYDKKLIPKKNVFVISCIDLRLTDDTVRFLHNDNLANRYDHFILAGTSLCTCVEDKADYKNNRAKFNPEALTAYQDFKDWRTSLNHHLAIAIKLHHVKDVYIIEHTNCGAYKEFLKEEFSDPDIEVEQHKHYAEALAKELSETNYEELKLDDNGMPKKTDEGYETEKYNLKVHCYLINLRGDVDHLSSFHKVKGKVEQLMQSDV